MASKILKNTTASPIVINDVGSVTIPASPGQYVIPPQDYLVWAASSDVVAPIGTGDLVVSDGLIDLNAADGISLIQFGFPQGKLKSPKNHTISIALANTEQMFAFRTGTKAFQLSNVSKKVVQLAYTSTESGSNFFTMYPGDTYWENDIIEPQVTIYIQSDQTGKALEGISWI